jgi:hypothetical protein
MLDQAPQPSADIASTLDGQHFDLVVIGAGIPGLNALNSAAAYLQTGAKVLLLDQKDAAGGMWTIAYDYVRLHQPHPMFTVGNMKWNWRKPKDYLAARDEVQSHLQACLGPIADKLRLTQGFGQTVSEFREIDTPEGPRGEVTFHANAQANAPGTVTADQVIHAIGFNYKSPAPLTLGSAEVVSIAPSDLRATLRDGGDAPVFVVGGGKTGMDTVLEVLRQTPKREVVLLAGKGTDFFNRSEYLPVGRKRWTGGKPLSRTFHDLAMRFDGDNEGDLSTHFKSTYATHRGSMNQQFLYGLLSEEELARINAGLKETIHDYLVDVSDGPGGPEMHLRGGRVVAVPAGSVIVNCTGNVFRAETPEENHPCLSRNGRVLSINVHDAMHFLPSVSGFFLPHLHYRGVLEASGFYMIDQEALFRKDRMAWIAATSTQAYLNQTLAVQTLPLMLLDQCGLDFDRWYPFPRRMAALFKMKMRARDEVAHCRRVLDRVAERFDVHCAPVVRGGVAA